MYTSNDKSSNNTPTKPDAQKQTPPAKNINDPQVTPPEQNRTPNTPEQPGNKAIKPEVVS